MAKPKVKILVECDDNSRHIKVYCDNPTEAVWELKNIEGIQQVIYSLSFPCISVWCDPRYDREEIAQEIRDLLTAEVPDAFREMQ